MKEYIEIIRKPLIAVFFVTCALFTAIGNFPSTAWINIKLSPISQYFYEPFTFYQGWSMYTTFPRVAPIRYRYKYSNGSVVTFYSPYAYHASFWPTEHGNLDAGLVNDSTGQVTQPVLRYYCSHPEPDDQKPTVVYLDYLNVSTPTMSMPFPVPRTTYYQIDYRVCGS